MSTGTIKTRAKNFSNDEITTLVDLVLENKSKLFGAFSSKLTSSDKKHFGRIYLVLFQEITEPLGARGL